MDLLSGLKRIANSRDNKLLSTVDLALAFKGLLAYLSNLEKSASRNTGGTPLSVVVNQDLLASGDGPAFDAFSRLRVSNPLTLFNSQFTYGLNQLIFQRITTGAGASVSHSATDRCASIAFSSTPTGGAAYMQSYEHFTYQPGKGQLVFMTFNFQGGAANILKFAGYSDGVNGIEFQLNGTGPRFAIYSGTAAGNQFVAQSDWNLDKLDGTGLSAITLDVSKAQILVIDLQALYAGRVRVGFDIGGSIIYAHEFLHANIFAAPYLQTATLPIRCGMTCTATVSSTMYFLCATVISEGGVDEAGAFGYDFSQSTGPVNVGTTATHMLTLRPRLLWGGTTNRSKVILTDVQFFNSGNQPVRWQLCIGQALSGTTTFLDVNSTFSSTEYNTAGTISGSPLVIADEEIVPASGSTKGAQLSSVGARYPITLDVSGSHRVNGSVSLRATSLSGTQTCYAVVKFKEIG